MEYQVCSKTIMDTTAPNIVFDENGISDYFHHFHRNILPAWQTDERGKKDILLTAEKIKKFGKEKDFDCLLGVSGGLDSSYATYIAKEILGLRPLLFHVDTGWNSAQAVSNIKKLCDGLNLELFTEVINWEEMKDLQAACFTAQIPDLDLPQDIAFFSSLYKFAVENNIKYVLTGGNFSTECCIEPQEWGAYPGIDKTLIADIHHRFGKIPLRTFPIIDILTYGIYYKYIRGLTVIKPLNFFPYIKQEAENLLAERFGWQKFQQKHYESRFTRFFEGFWLPRKFGYDKRRAYFSSLILTNQMTRDEALERIAEPEFDEHFFTQEFEYVAKKLGFTIQELKALFEGENKTYRNYKNKKLIINFGAEVSMFLGMEKRLYR